MSERITKVYGADPSVPDFADFDSADLTSRLDETRAAYNAALGKSVQECMTILLTQRQSDCFIMYYTSDMTEKEISENLGISVSTVSRHLKAARKKLLCLKPLGKVRRCVS